MARTRIAAVAVAALLGTTATAAAAPTITEYSTNLTADSAPYWITAGPDGNLWFTENDGNNIGRITTDGLITQFAVPGAGSKPTGITAGPDGALWFTESATAQIGRITTAGVITSEYDSTNSDLTANSTPYRIVAGPDGNLWFTETAAPGRIGRITPAGVVDEFPTGLTGGSYPNAIAAGPDGNFWFTSFNTGTGRIGRITPDGATTDEFSAGLTAGTFEIAAGPDGNLWFGEANGPGPIGRITPGGVVTEFDTGLTADPYAIAAGPDGNLWFAELDDPGRIGRITPAGVITEYTTGLTPNSGPYGITAGPDGAMWFTELTGDRIGRITVGPGVTTGAATGVTSTAATLNGTARPNGQLTTFRFQYGTGTGYGSQTPLDQLTGQDASAHSVSAALTGLSPSTTYHYRLVATNDSDTTRGSDRTFTTTAAGAVPPAKADLSGSKSSIRVNRKRRFRFGFRATADLTGKIVFKSRKKVQVSRRKRITLARKQFTVPDDGRVKLKLRLSKKNFRILKRERKIRTRAVVTLENTAGLTSKARKRVTLKAPRRR